MRGPLLWVLLIEPSLQAADLHVQLIRLIVRPELAVPTELVPAVRRAIARPSVCVPDGSVTLSLVNKHHSYLRHLQFHFIRHRPCFMRRLVSVTYNNVTDSFGSCVPSTFVVPASDFRRSNYANMIWAKWRILRDALTVAKQALWLDADVLILRNPWTTLGLLGEQAATADEYDIRYQSEPPPASNVPNTCNQPIACNVCSRINGGQLFLTSRALAAAIYGARPQNLSNTDRLDQDWADAILHKRSGFAFLLGNASHGNYHPPRRRWSSCILPLAFASQCWSNSAFVRGFIGNRSYPGEHKVLGCKRATHHFNCFASRRIKGIMMKELIHKWGWQCGNRTAYE